MNSKVKEYFKNPAFKELLDNLKDKYISYGKCVGSIKITPNEEEALSLSAFISYNIKENTINKIKVSSIQKALDDSIFEGLSVDELILILFPNTQTKYELENKKNLFLESKINKYKKMYKDSNIYKIFDNVNAIKDFKHLIKKEENLIFNVFKSLDNLPIFNENTSNLAIFASATAGGPHYYDLDTHNSNVLIQFICYLFNYTYVNNRNNKRKILENVGIFVDEVVNSVITYNLSGNKLLDAFYNLNTPLTINLSNLSKIKKINCKNNCLLIIENPSFISKINEKDIDYSVIVTSGNSNLVVYKLLELIDSNVKMYFNGDFDPEGLLIAQKFKEKYKNLKFIGYNKKYFDNGISNNIISTARLKKLNNISCNDLLEVRSLLLEYATSSYQEANYDLLLDDIEKELNN